jgi:hypothetical protein
VIGCIGEEYVGLNRWSGKMRMNECMSGYRNTADIQKNAGEEVKNLGAHKIEE